MPHPSAADERSRPEPPRGFALIIVLWALVLLTLLVTQLTATGRAETRLASNLRGAAVAQAAADGCVYQVVEQLLAGTTPWPPGPAPLQLAVPGARATVTIGSEDGKFDLNSAPPDILAQLLRAVGVGVGDSQQIAIDIALWRFPSAQTAERGRAYAAAGLPYLPPGSSFQSVAELSLVLGVTPDILARLRPHVTVYHEGDPDPRFADPVVRTVLRLRGDATDAQPPPGRPTGTAVIDVAAQTPGGSRATRHAILRIGSPSDKNGWRILVWD